MWWDTERVPTLEEVREVVCTYRGNQCPHELRYEGLGRFHVTPDPSGSTPVGHRVWFDDLRLARSLARVVAATAPPQRLKVAVVASGIPQHRLAYQLRISPPRLSRLVRGHAVPTPDEEDRLAEAVGVPRAWLFPAK
jgi:hypothetical protein